MSIGKPENELIATRVENTIEIALPFVDDFFQNSESGDVMELEVRRLFLLQVPMLSIPLPQFTCQPENLGNLTFALTSRSELVRELLASELVYVPTQATTSDEQIESRVTNLVEALEEHEDTLRVYTTLDSGAN